MIEIERLVPFCSIHGRLVDPSPDRSADGASILHSSSASWPPLAAWLARFGSTTAELNATEAVTSAATTAVAAAEAVLKIKAKARAAEGAAKAAAKAAEQGEGIPEGAGTWLPRLLRNMLLNGHLWF